MNCERRDIVRVSDPESESYGAVTRVVMAYPAGWQLWGKEYGPVWEVETPLKAYFGQCEVLTTFYPDIALKPIRDPGEDAVDEMVKRCPVPLPEIIPAMLDRETV